MGDRVGEDPPSTGTEVVEEEEGTLSVGWELSSTTREMRRQERIRQG